MQPRSATLPTVFTQWLQLRLALLFNKPHCFHRHTHVSEALHPPLAPQVLSELASVNIRLFPFAAALAKRGHTVLVSDPDHLHQVPIATLTRKTSTSQLQTTMSTPVHNRNQQLLCLLMHRICALTPMLRCGRQTCISRMPMVW